MRVCEFYSGIGGYHLALAQVPGISYDVVAAFEISSNANCIYKHNFPNTPVLETNLCGLTAKRLGSILQKSSDLVVTSSPRGVLFVMSPPCQPFTRQGARKDNLDNRSESVLHLFEMFSELQELPEYFLIENVKGFETSNTRNTILTFLNQHNYHIREFLLNSNTLGIPNSRLRYYLLARKHPFPSTNDSPTSDLLAEIPGLSPQDTTPQLSRYLESSPQGFDIPAKFLRKWGRVLDLVTPGSARSCCFTKGYSVKAEGAGSVIQQAGLGKPNCQGDPPRNELSQQDSELEGDAFTEHMESLDLRFFTPREIARIHGIPDSYKFPESLSNKQLYKLIGNGLNITVVKLLMENVLFKD